MGATIACLYAFQCGYLGQNESEQSATAQFNEADTGNRRHHNLVQFIDNAFLRYNLDALCISL